MNEFKGMPPTREEVHAYDVAWFHAIVEYCELTDYHADYDRRPTSMR